jgi:FMN phosphatase YigB (HAD superfamily)
VPKNQILYVGDDLEPDIMGARQAGLQPVWTTYVRDQGIAYVPGILSTGRGTPDSDVPTISTWRDLLSLLEKP